MFSSLAAIYADATTSPIAALEDVIAGAHQGRVSTLQHLVGEYRAALVEEFSRGSQRLAAHADRLAARLQEQGDHGGWAAKVQSLKAVVREVEG